jgi:RecQ family ATP-dependent DNA helicase
MQSELFHEILKEYWGYDTFRPLQEEIIQSVWEQKDTLGLMPTGGGKSLTFQVPVMAQEGICLVITPLIALMKDQVDQLRERGIKAAAVYSGMSREEIITNLENCIFGDFKFLYVSPERLSNDIFRAKLQAMNVNLIVVDESHCISQWGYDFRPSYLEIAEIRTLLPHVPVLALTATATKEVVSDIQEKLHFKEKNVFRRSFERKNLSYVVRNAENKTTELVHILHSVPGTAIVYVRSRKGTKQIANALQKAGISADHFHAGLSYEEKNYKQDAWKQNQFRVIVATNAFGMGIDKPDVRVVVHYDLPNSLEEYYQEAGRAGRDGKRSYAVILYEKADFVKLKKRITDTFPPKEFVVRVYEALGNYYQIAVGAGYNNVYDFNLHDFCNRFRFPFLQTHHTLIVFTSDNGPHREGGNDPDYFNSNGIYRGYKRDLYEGGIRVPTVVSWEGHVLAGTESHFAFAFWDYLPTFAELLGRELPVKSDGISVLPMLTGKKGQKEHDFFYFEFHELNGRQAVIRGNWKLLHLNIQKEPIYELYNIASDPSEVHNVISLYPEKAEELKKIMQEAHAPDPNWPLFN